MTDKGLIGNDKIEEDILMLQQQPTPEILAVTLSAIRRRMNQGGQFVVAVAPGSADSLQLRVIDHDGGKWLEAYTSFDEQMKGPTQVMSTFMADIGQVLKMALESDQVQGLILNPYNRTIMLDKTFLRLILGKQKESRT